MDGTDEEVFRRVPAARPDPNRFTLISHGTVEERYGLDTAIDAVALLRNEIPELVLKIYGEGSDLGRLHQLADRLGVADRVYFSDGFVPIDELRCAISSADVGVVAMKRDVFRDVTLAGKMFDFIAMGLPMVVSRTRSVEQTFPTRLLRAVRVGQPGRSRTGPASAARRPGPPGAARHSGGRRRRSVPLGASAGTLPEHRGGPARRCRTGSPAPRTLAPTARGGQRGGEVSRTQASISRRPDHRPSSPSRERSIRWLPRGWLERLVVQGAAFRLVPVHQSQCVGSIFVKVWTQAGVEHSREIIRHTLRVPPCRIDTEGRSAGLFIPVDQLARFVVFEFGQDFAAPQRPIHPFHRQPAGRSRTKPRPRHQGCRRAANIAAQL